MLDKMSDASRIVEKLRTKGLIERHICEHDRRSCQVFITQKGMDLLSDIDKEESTQQEVMKTLSETEKQQLNILLDKLRG
jgi:DNA-binding MarR family transcriptional regulator